MRVTGTPYVPYGGERGKSFLVNRARGPPKLVIKRSSNFLSMQNARREQKDVASPCYRYNYDGAAV